MSSADLVYRGLSQEELDREYSPSSRVQSIDPFLQAWEQRSTAARAALEPLCDLRYAAGERRTLDFFPSAMPASPLLLFIHGGYWRELTKDESSFLAPSFVNAGAAFAALDYPLAPTVSLPEIVDACENALLWLTRRAEEFGFDNSRIVVVGMSAGAHLAAMLATGSHAELISATVAISGVYDLEPIRLSYVNEPLGLDERAAALYSPIRRVRFGLAPLIVGYGDNETDELKRQSREMAVAWEALGNACHSIEVAGRHHFDVIDACADAQSDLGAAVFDCLGLAPR